MNKIIIPARLAKVVKLNQIEFDVEGRTVYEALNSLCKKYVELNEMALNIYKNYLPGQITVISKSKGILKPPVVSATGGVGVRYPDYAYTLQLIQKFGRPITQVPLPKDKPWLI